MSKPSSAAKNYETDNVTLIGKLKDNLNADELLLEAKDKISNLCEERSCHLTTIDVLETNLRGFRSEIRELEAGLCFTDLSVLSDLSKVKTDNLSDSSGVLR